MSDETTPKIAAKVEIVDVQMRFISMVEFLVKLVLAAICALLVLAAPVALLLWIAFLATR